MMTLCLFLGTSAYSRRSVPCSSPPSRSAQSVSRQPPAAARGPARMATGLAVFIAEKRAELAPGAEELDWEDEWDDLTRSRRRRPTSR